MNPADKHYKFINSETGYVIHYHTLNCPAEKIKEELEKVKLQVAVRTNIFSATIYWEEIKEE